MWERKNLAIFVIALVTLSAILSALPAAAQETASKPVIVFDESHGQYYNSERLGYFISDLRKVYTVIINRDPISDETLSNATVLIITNPRSPITDAEAAAIARFVQKGGIAIVMGDWYRYINIESLNKITEPAGILFTATSIWDKSHYDYRYYYPLVFVQKGSPLGDFLAQRVRKPVKYSGCYLKVNSSVKVFLATRHTAVAYDKDKKTIKGGVMPVGAYARIGKGYIVALGGSRIAYTSHFYEDATLGNRAFMLALIAWAVEQAGYRVLPVKITVDVSPWMIPVGEASEVKLNVTVEALGENLGNLKVTVTSPFLKGEKNLPSLNNTERETFQFTATAKPGAPGAVPINVTVSSSAGSTTYTRTLYAVKEGEGVVFDYSHGEYYWLYRLSGFTSLLSKYGTVAASKRPLDEALKYAKILVLLNPSKRFTYDEASSIRDWVKGGGILLVFGSYYAHFEPIVLNTVTSPAGINWLDGSVRDKAHSTGGHDYLVYLSEFPDNPIARAASQGVDKVLYSGTSLTLSGDAEPVLVGYKTTVTVDRDGRILANGSKVVAVAVSKLGKGYIVAVGGVFTVLDYSYGVHPFSENRRFFENLIAALASQQAQPPKPPVKKVYIPLLKASLATKDKRILVKSPREAFITVSNVGNGTAISMMIQLVGSNMEVSLDGKNWTRAATIKVGNLTATSQYKTKIYFRALEPGDATLRVVIISANTDPMILKADFVAVAPQPAGGVNTALVAGGVAAVAAIAAALLLLRRRSRGKSAKSKKKNK